MPLIPKSNNEFSIFPDTGGWGVAVGRGVEVGGGVLVGAVTGVLVGAQVIPGMVVSQMGPKVSWAKTLLLGSKMTKTRIK